MVAEVVHGAPYRFNDPARFSLAHGGKDRHPFPVPIKVYDETIRVLKAAIQKAKLGREEEMQRDQAARRPGAAAGAHCAWTIGRSLYRRRACGLARSRRPLRVRLGARSHPFEQVDRLLTTLPGAIA